MNKVQSTPTMSVSYFNSLGRGSKKRTSPEASEKRIITRLESRGEMIMRLNNRVSLYAIMN